MKPLLIWKMLLTALLKILQKKIFLRVWCYRESIYITVK